MIGAELANYYNNWVGGLASGDFYVKGVLYVAQKRFQVEAYTWRNHRLPSPPQINLFICLSVSLSVSLSVDT